MSVAARLRKLEEGTTPGPWEAMAEGSEGYGVRGYRGERRHRLALVGHGAWDDDKADALLIATVRNLLPLLADLAEAAEEVRENIDEELDVLLARVDAALARVADQLDHEEAK